MRSWKAFPAQCCEPVSESSYRTSISSWPVTALQHLASQTAVPHLDVPEAVQPDVIAPSSIELSKQERNALKRAFTPATLAH
jgi:hypothetical protein